MSFLGEGNDSGSLARQFFLVIVLGTIILRTLVMVTNYFSLASFTTRVLLIVMEMTFSIIVDGGMDGPTIG